MDFSLNFPFPVKWDPTLRQWVRLEGKEPSVKLKIREKSGK